MNESAGRFVRFHQVPSPSRQISSELTDMMPSSSSPPPDLPPRLADIDGQLQDHFRTLQNGFQKLDKVKDPNRQSKQLEELTAKMRECKRLIKEFDQEVKEEESNYTPAIKKQLNERKQSLIKELNSYVALRKTYTSALGNKRGHLLDGGHGEPLVDDNVKFASTMTNQELIDSGNKTMDETDQAIERSKKVVQDTVDIGTQTAQTLKKQTEQMGRIVNELDAMQFSIKKASQLVKEIGRQIATDRCIMLFLFLIVCGVIAIIIVKIVHPNNKNIRDIPGLAPPASGGGRKLLMTFVEQDACGLSGKVFSTVSHRSSQCVFSFILCQPSTVLITKVGLTVTCSSRTSRCLASSQI